MRVIGARIRSLREDRGWDAGVLAYKTGVSASYIYKLESGNRENASGAILGEIAKSLGTTMEYLIGATNDPRPLPPPEIDVEMEPEHLLRLQELAERVARLPEPRQRAVYEALATEALTADRVRATLADADTIDDLAPALQRRVDQAQGEIQDLDTAIRRLVAAVEAGGDIPALVSALAARQAEMDRARRDLSAAERELRALRSPAVDEALIEDFCLHLGQALGEGEPRAVRRLFEALKLRVDLHDGRHGGTISYRLPAELGGLSGYCSFDL